MLFRVAWLVDVVAAAIGVGFFLVGIADGTVSSFNIALWLALLAGLAVVVLGSRALRRNGRDAAALALASLLALPALLFALMIAVAIVGGVRWN
jgi:hypothetical protein